MIDNNVSLVTLTDLKNYLKIASDETGQDEIVGNLANEVSTWVSSYCGRTLQTQTLTEYYDGQGDSDLLLDNYPIITVTSLYDDPTRAFGGASQINLSTEVVVLKDAGIIRLINYGFNQGVGNVKVVYSAGYSQSTCPHDLRLAIKKLVAIQYKIGFSAGAVGIKSQSIGDRNLTYIEDEVPKDVFSILRRYVSWKSPSGSST